MVRKWRQWPWEKKLGLATLAVTMVGAAIPLAIWAADALRAHSPGPKVSASELLVENPNLASGSSPGVPRVELVLHNDGDRAAAVTRLRVTVRDALFLGTCYIQGELGVAQSFGVTLPRDARRGTVVQSGPLRRSLHPDEVERLAFKFHLPTPLQHGKPVGVQFNEDTYLYRLDLAVLHDANRVPAVVGTVIVALPYGAAEDQIWTSEDSRMAAAAKRNHLSWSVPRRAIACMESNSAKLRTFLEGPGERSTDLESLPHRLRAAT
jgi:hypothetical protein